MSTPDRETLLYGIDFTSAPCKRKGITIASGILEADTYRLQSLHCFNPCTLCMTSMPLKPGCVGPALG